MDGIVTQYHPALPNLKDTLMGKWHLIDNQPQLRNIFKEPPIISYRKGKSLKDILVKANTRFPLELEVSGRDVSELAVSSSKIFFTSSEASPRQDDNFEREERSICAGNCSLFFKMAENEGQLELYEDWGRVSFGQPLCNKSLNKNKSR